MVSSKSTINAIGRWSCGRCIIAPATVSVNSNIDKEIEAAGEKP